jgi:hypothetical protein
VKSNKLSSDRTVFFKRLFPLAWYGICAVALYAQMRSYDGDGRTLMFAVIPLVCAIIGYFVFRTFFAPLLDELYDEGDFLRIIIVEEETHVSVRDIVGVKYHKIFNPKVVELTMQPGHKPEVLKFLPRQSYFSIEPVPEVVDLMERIRSH